MSQSKLTVTQIEIAAQRMMMGAIAHQRTSVYCRRNPDAKVPNIDSVYFLAVGCELILLSIEQSLKLLLLVRHSVLRTHHNIFRLYNELSNKNGRSAELVSKLIEQTNTVSHRLSKGAIHGGGVHACLKKHDSSYVNFRYFDLDIRGRITDRWGVKQFELHVLDCLAFALLEVGRDEMLKRNIDMLGSMRKVPESEITDELRELTDRMKEWSTR